MFGDEGHGGFTSIDFVCETNRTRCFWDDASSKKDGTLKVAERLACNRTFQSIFTWRPPRGNLKSWEKRRGFPTDVAVRQPSE
jgi:hypothetical protein